MNEKRNTSTIMRQASIFGQILSGIYKTLHLDKAKFTRAQSYLSPGNFFNHRSKTFSSNQRAERKLSRKRARA